MKILQSKPIEQQVQPQQQQVDPKVIDTSIATVDLEQEVLDEPLDESAGLNQTVEDLAQVAVETLQLWVAKSAYDVIDSLSDKATPFRFSDPQLTKSVLGNFMIQLVMRQGNKPAMISFGGAEVEKVSTREVITIYIEYNNMFKTLPERTQIKNLQRVTYTPEVLTAFVHEFTHVHEESKRSKNDSGSIYGNKIDTLSKIMMDTPLLANIGRRIYLIDSSELNARVAEVGAIMKSVSADTTRDELMALIKNSRVWKEINFLKDFPAEAVYAALIKNIQQLHSKDLPQNDIAAAEAMIAEKFSDVLLDQKWMSNSNGHSKTNTRLQAILAHKIQGTNGGFKVKELKDILKGLELLFSERAEELKKRVLKTITLANKPQVEIKSELEPELELAEEVIDEAYPEVFDRRAFHDLRNFTQRIKYCREHLTYLAQGSSRIVFAIDDEKVLKLAKNAKGIVQNEGEGMQDMQRDYGDLVAKIFDSHPLDLWIEMEKAVKISVSKFKQITGIAFNDMGVYLSDLLNNNYHRSLDSQKKIFMDDNEFMQEVTQLVGNYELLPGDIAKIDSWGVVKRDGRELAVLVDFGISKSAFQTHYTEPAIAKANAGMYRHEAYLE